MSYIFGIVKSSLSEGQVFFEYNNKLNNLLQVPKAFAANHLPFVGFTYSRDYQLLSVKDSFHNSVQDTVDVVSKNGTLFLSLFFFYFHNCDKNVCRDKVSKISWYTQDSGVWITSNTVANISRYNLSIFCRDI